MKKRVALLLASLLTMTMTAAMAEPDYSSYTNAELRKARIQMDAELALRSENEETNQAVCNAFMLNMRKLGHPLELSEAYNGNSAIFVDTQLSTDSIVYMNMSAYVISLLDNLASDEVYIRDCMVALAMAVAKVEGIEIYSNKLSNAMDSCEWQIPDGFFLNEHKTCWENDYGYSWILYTRDDFTYFRVR